MARDFTKNTSNRMELGANAIGSSLNGASKILFHCFAQGDTYTVSATGNGIFACGIDATNTLGLTININNAGANPILRAAARSQAADTGQDLDGVTTISTGTLFSLGALIDIGGDTMQSFINGVAESAPVAKTFGASTYTQSTPTDQDRIGSRLTNNVTNQFDGKIAEICIAVFGASEAVPLGLIKALAKGRNPIDVLGSNLKHYWPLIGRNSPEPDIIGVRNGTIVGTIGRLAHPPVLFPNWGRKPALKIVPGGGGGGETIITIIQRRRRRMG